MQLRDEVEALRKVETERQALADKIRSLEAEVQAAEKRGNEHRAKHKASELKQGEMVAALARRDREIEQLQASKIAAEAAQNQLQQRLAVVSAQLASSGAASGNSEGSTQWSEVTGFKSKMAEAEEAMAR
jgi:predicted RNase H-like nuclease (RuvC/YqgF family)